MSIECSHCGAMNPVDSMFCGECGWQILPQDAELELEQAFVAGRAKAAPVDLKAKPEGEPADSEAEPEPAPVATSAELEAEGAEIDAGPDVAPAGLEAEPEPPPAAISAEPEVEGAEIDAGPDVLPAGFEAEPEPAPAAISTEPEAFWQAEIDAGPDVAPAGLEAGQEATPGAIPSPEESPDAYGEGVAITDSAAMLGDRIYAWADILSVAMEISRANRLPSLLLAVVGAIILALAVAGIRSNPMLGTILVIGGLSLLAIGAVLAATARDAYMVCVKTASGVEAALISTDRERVERIVQAMRLGLSEQDLPGQV